MKKTDMTAFDGAFLAIFLGFIVTVAANLVSGKLTPPFRCIAFNIILFLLVLLLIILIFRSLQKHFNWSSAIFDSQNHNKPIAIILIFLLVCLIPLCKIIFSPEGPSEGPSTTDAPTATPTPTPAPTPETFYLTYGSDTVWTVQVASVKAPNKHDASTDAERLRDEGYNPFIFVEKNSKYYRVAVGAFSSKSDAESLCNELNFNPVAREMNIHGAAVVELTVPSEIPEKYADPRF